ncbi:MAG: hypothetical protein NUK57_03575 [Gudongella sp.]|nr:hypothetical protein [Gudongella sp.]
MRVYLGLKYHRDYRNGEIIEEILRILEGNGYDTSCIVKDYAMGRECCTNPTDLMEETFKRIDSCDLVVIEFSEKGVGLGIEAGYAFAKGIPVITIARAGTQISETLEGISSRVIKYGSLNELRDVKF